MFGCNYCRPKGEDEEEDDNITFPTSYSQFTPDGQRMTHSNTYTNTPPMPMTMRSSENTTSLSVSGSQMALADDPYAPPPVPHRVTASSPPPYPFAVREGAGFGSEGPRTHRTEPSLGGTRSSQLESAGLGRPHSKDLTESSP